jgi:hypothetical protein
VSDQASQEPHKVTKPLCNPTSNHLDSRCIVADPLSIQTNALAPVLLSLLLRPLLAKSSAPRIVFTTSEVHAWVPEKSLNGVGEDGTVLNFFDREREYVGMVQYMQSKVSRRGTPGRPITRGPTPCCLSRADRFLSWCFKCSSAA